MIVVGKSISLFKQDVLPSRHQNNTPESHPGMFFQTHRIEAVSERGLRKAVCY